VAEGDALILLGLADINHEEKGSMNVKAVFLVFCLIIGWPWVSFSQQGNQPKIENTLNTPKNARLEELLVCPPCLESYSDTAKSFSVEVVTIPSGEITLHGELYLPKEQGPYPAVIYMHGGGNNYNMFRRHFS